MRFPGNPTIRSSAWECFSSVEPPGSTAERERRFRRVSPVPVGAGERPFTEPTSRRQSDRRATAVLIGLLPDKPLRKLAGGESDGGGQGFREGSESPWARRRLRSNQAKWVPPPSSAAPPSTSRLVITVSPATVKTMPRPRNNPGQVLEDLGTAPPQLLLPSVRRNPEASNHLGRPRSSIAAVRRQKRLHGR